MRMAADERMTQGVEDLAGDDSATGEAPPRFTSLGK